MSGHIAHRVWVTRLTRGVSRSVGRTFGSQGAEEDCADCGGVWGRGAGAVVGCGGFDGCAGEWDGDIDGRYYYLWM